MTNVKKPVKSKNGYVMPEPIPLGEILTDAYKRMYKIGPSIGKGGFGEIYTACEKDSNTPTSKYPFVAKIEPHANGPLFVEMHFYMKNAKKEDIDDFCKSHKLAKLGMPEYITSGSHFLPNKNKYRFLIMQRFTTDLQYFFKKAGCLPEYSILRIALQMTDVLEYIHHRKYVHADIKAANILLNSSMDQAYLVDFGLAMHYKTQDLKPDPKLMHNGTIEYTSRDAHLGIPTRRGDFEILAYNLIHWAGGMLPWEKNLKSPVAVQTLKEEAAKNIDQFLKKCFSKREAPQYISQFINLIMNMTNGAEPNYSKIRGIFQNALTSSGKSLKGKFDLSLDNGDNKVSSPKPDMNKTDTPVKQKEKILKLNKKNLKVSPKKSNKKAVSPKNVTPAKKPNSTRLGALKKKNILEYSICEDEDVEIIVKKTNTKTGEVKTQKFESEPIDKVKSESPKPRLGIRSSPRINSRNKRYADDSDDDMNNSNEENKTLNKKVNRRKASQKTTSSNWQNSPTMKASKASNYLKRSKLTE